MQIPKRLLLTTVLILTACSNMPQDENTGLKAYPNPYNPTAGVLTIERADGAAFPSPAQHDLVIYDYGLHEVYRANPQPVDSPANKKIVWSGYDSSGVRVAPGIYYLKLVTIGASSAGSAISVSNADSMFKLVVQ